VLIKKVIQIMLNAKMENGAQVQPGTTCLHGRDSWDNKWSHNVLVNLHATLKVLIRSLLLQLRLNAKSQPLILKKKVLTWKNAMPIENKLLTAMMVKDARSGLVEEDLLNKDAWRKIYAKREVLLGKVNK